VLSTRESAALRGRLMHLGITQMSAGSCTRPGGYGDKSDAGEQFEVSDTRSPMEVAASLEAAGFEPVWKNWDAVFCGGASE
jgi:2-iminoacetate synthase